MSFSREDAQAAVFALVKKIVVELVDDPSRVTFERISGASAIVIEITALPPEVGQIIGRAGRNIHALQAVAQAVGAKHGLDCQVVVLDHPRSAAQTEETS